MAIYSDIQTALETKLQAFASSNDYAVAWPNVGHKPDGNAYLLAFSLPAEPSILGLTAGSADNYSGIYQVDVRVKKGTGLSLSRAMIDGLITEFSKAATQTAGAAKVVIQKAWASNGFDIDDAWHSIPVSISYRVIA